MYHAHMVNYSIYFKHFKFFILKTINSMLKLHIIYVIEKKI